MRFLKSISLLCIIVIFILILIYLLYDWGYPSENKKEDGSFIQNQTTEEMQDLSVSTKSNVVTCDTVYEIEQYRGKTREDSFAAEVPFYFLGLNREELIEEIARYEASPDFEDKKKGLLSMELISFHPKQIRVKKVYAPEEEKIIYYVKAIDHELCVYRSDNMDEIFMATDLTLEMLPDEVKEQIISTKCFNTIGEVYAFLESYTS